MSPPQKRDNDVGQGFVYFNNSTPSPKRNCSNTSDFLSFSSESSPGTPPYAFHPSDSSSPINHYYGKKARGRSDRPHHPYGYMTKSWRKNGGLTHQNNNDQSNTNNYRYENRQQRKHINKDSKPRNGNHSLLYDHSCLKDPWQELQKVAQRSPVVKTSNSRISDQSLDETCTSKLSSTFSEDKSDHSDNGSYEAEESSS